MLDAYEKLIFITLKKFADNDTNQCFPGVKKISEITGLSVRKVQYCINHMTSLGVIKVEERFYDEGGHKSNLYTLHDYEGVWKINGREDTEVVAKKVAEELETERLLSMLKEKKDGKEKVIEFLMREGYEITKKKAPDCYSAKDNQEPNYETNERNAQNTSVFTHNYRESRRDCQGNYFSETTSTEEYSMEFIREHYDYAVMVGDGRVSERDVDAVMNILYNALNTKKETLRVAGQEHEREVVKGRLLKLNYMEIEHVIESFNNQTEKVHNPSAYILTLLYNSFEDTQFGSTNEAVSDMARGNK